MHPSSRAGRRERTRKLSDAQHSTAQILTRCAVSVRPWQLRSANSRLLVEFLCSMSSPRNQEARKASRIPRMPMSGIVLSSRKRARLEQLPRDGRFQSRSNPPTSTGSLSMREATFFCIERATSSKVARRGEERKCTKLAGRLRRGAHVEEVFGLQVCSVQRRLRSTLVDLGQ